MAPGGMIHDASNVYTTFDQSAEIQRLREENERLKVALACERRTNARMREFANRRAKRELRESRKSA